MPIFRDEKKTPEQEIEALEDHLKYTERIIGKSKKDIDKDYIAHLKKELAHLKSKLTGGRSRKSRKTRKSRKSRKA